jgi:hypothetical protein
MEKILNRKNVHKIVIKIYLMIIFYLIFETRIFGTIINLNETKFLIDIKRKFSEFLNAFLELFA